MKGQKSTEKIEQRLPVTRVICVRCIECGERAENRVHYQSGGGDER